MSHATFKIWRTHANGGGMELSRIPIPPIPDHLKQVIEEQKS